MMLTKLDIKVGKDNFNTMVNSILKTTRKELLVGIPELSVDREEGGMSNAALAYIHEHGSPLQNIPARPFMDSGIDSVRKSINEQLFEVAKACMENDGDKIGVLFEKAGLVAVNGIRNYIANNNDFAPLAESTKRSRFNRIKSNKSKSLSRRSESMAGYKPLIDTAQMLKSITYVVVDK